MKRNGELHRSAIEAESNDYDLTTRCCQKDRLAGKDKYGLVVRDSRQDDADCSDNDSVMQICPKIRLFTVQSTFCTQIKRKRINRRSVLYEQQRAG